MRNDIINVDSMKLYRKMYVAKCLTHIRDSIDKPRRASIYGICRHRNPVLSSNKDGAHELHRSDTQRFQEFTFEVP